MLVLASLAAQLPAGIGAIAACMAICGFLLQASPAMKGEGEEELRRRAAKGGVVGLGIGLVVAVLSVTLPS